VRTRAALAPAALVLAALAAALVPLPRAFVERWYSTFLYLHVQHVVTRVSNLFPFALFDALIAAVLAAWFLFAIADFRRRKLVKVAIVKVAIRTATWTAILYLAFLFLWGFNYRRVPLVVKLQFDKLQFDSQAPSPDAVLALANTAVDQLNALHAPAHAMGWPGFGTVETSLAEALDRVQRQLGGTHAFVPARPKRTVLNPLFRLSGVDGMTDPYFLETLLESGMLPFERPAAIAHEWGHLAGFADESEASFVGWLACLHGSTADQYSGWLFLMEELIPAVPQQDRASLVRRIAPGPLADLRAIAKRQRTQVNRVVAGASGRIYDRYLKANRVEAGIASYDEVVRLILGVRYGPDWTPLLATHALP
jgi:hypothetical protein